MSRTWVLTGCLLLVIGCDKPAPPPDEKRGERVPQSVEDLRGQLSGEEMNLRYLVRGWETVRPFCLEILRDQKSKPIHVDRMLHLVKLVGVKDAAFLEVALDRVSDQDAYVRHAAITCLAVLGDERHTALVAVHLLDPDATLRNAAAKTLVAIGGKSEVRVFDMLLKNVEVYHHKDGQRILWDFDVKHFTQYRDELKAKLKNEDEPKEKK